MPRNTALRVASEADSRQLTFADGSGGLAGRGGYPAFGGDFDGPLAFLNADMRGGTGPNGRPSLTVTGAGAQLTRSNLSWMNEGGVQGAATTVTFAFRSTAPAVIAEGVTGFTRFNELQINMTLQALASWSDVANITFVRVGAGGAGDGAYSDDATILFGNHGTVSDSGAAFAFLPGNRASSSIAGDVWINIGLEANQTGLVFEYGRLTMVHEIGHAIGLDHPAEYNAGQGSPNYTQHATYYEDTLQYTIMSYFSETFTGGNFTPSGQETVYPAAPMMDDIMAAQRLYGANMTTRTGDTVYGFNSTAGRDWFHIANASQGAVFAVWDAGGIDTFDFSGYTQNQIIDLRAGAFSSVGGLVGNVGIAVGVTIERAFGGAGNDSLTGNAAANTLRGGGGDDVINGGAGDDIIDGGLGRDRFIMSGTAGTVNLNITTAQETGDGRDVLSGIENVTGTTGGDTIIGDGGANVIDGMAGNDLLSGGRGIDTLNGGVGDDRLSGGSGSDILDGGDGTDTLLLDVSAANYTVLRIAGGFTVVGLGDSDRVSNVERVSFDGGVTSISFAEFEQQAFDPFAYMVANPDIYAAYGLNAAAARNHYFVAGVNEGRSPGTFDALTYIASNADLLRAFGTNAGLGAEHYLIAGRNEGRAVNSFDALTYAASNTDLALAFGADQDAATRHYIAAGFNEGRATTGFNALLYAASNIDLARALGADARAATVDYLSTGLREGRPTTGFNALIYTASNLDLALAFGADSQAGLMHYLAAGANEGRAITGFDARAYTATHADLAAFFGFNANGALLHYLTNGAREGRATSGFDPVAYLLTNGDLAGMGASGAMDHWLGFGAREGRVGDAVFGREQASHGLTGATTAGTVNQAGDRDWFQLSATAGQAFTLDLAAAGSGAGTLGAGALSVYNALGQLISAGVNSGPGGDARASFTATTAGAYYVVVSGVGAAAGTYQVNVASGSGAPQTVPDMIDKIVAGDGYPQVNGGPGDGGAAKTLDDDPFVLPPIDDGVGVRGTPSPRVTGDGRMLTDPMAVDLGDRDAFVLSATGDDQGPLVLPGADDVFLTVEGFRFDLALRQGHHALTLALDPAGDPGLDDVTPWRDHNPGHWLQ